jgi:hypothetical protein
VALVLALVGMVIAAIGARKVFFTDAMKEKYN